jgi:N-methylhydantoinase B
LSKSQFSLNPGDWLRYKVPGGGGYQNPSDRDPSLVEEDVRNGVVSLRSAREDYGVVIDIGSLKIDEEATNKLRASLQDKFKKS